MYKITLKICGLKSARDVKICARPGVDILGFVTEYPLPVPWNLRRTEAAALLPLVFPPQKTCIVTGGTPEEVVELVQSLRPNLVQLHFKETLAETKKIVLALTPLGVGVIKTVPPSAEERIEQFGTSDPGQIARLLCEAGIAAILLDSRAPVNAAGQGREGGTKLAELYKPANAASVKPVILAGGINAGNAGAMLAQSGASHLDVMTGVERAPGVKDAQKLAGLLFSIDAFLKERGE